MVLRSPCGIACMGRPAKMAWRRGLGEGPPFHTSKWVALLNSLAARTLYCKSSITLKKRQVGRLKVVSGFEALMARSLQLHKAFICSAAVIYHRVYTTGTQGRARLFILHCSCWIAQDLRIRTFCRFDAALFSILTVAVAAGLVRLAVWCIKVCAWLWCESPKPRATPSNEQWLYVRKCALQTLHPNYQLGRTSELMGSKCSWCNMPVIITFSTVVRTVHIIQIQPWLWLYALFIHIAILHIKSYKQTNSPTVPNPKSVQNWQNQRGKMAVNICKPKSSGAVPQVSVHHK